jgi:hypothetical protein
MSNATLYLGAVKSGKTVLMREHVESIRRSEDAPLIFIVDHTDEWGDLEGVGLYRSAAEWWKTPSVCAVFQGAAPREVCQLAVDAGWSLYVDDEVDALVRDGKWATNPLREIIRRGRHLPNRKGQITEVGALVATQRPAGIPGDLIGLFERVYLGRLTSAGDCERVHKEGWLPECRNVAEVSAALRSRQPGDFSSWPA